MHGQLKGTSRIPNGFLRTDNTYTIDMLNKYTSAAKDVSTSYGVYEQMMYQAQMPHTPQHIVDSIYDSDLTSFQQHIKNYDSALKEIQAVDPNFTPTEKMQETFNSFSQELNGFEEKRRQHFKPYANEYDNHIQQQIQANTQLNKEQKE